MKISNHIIELTQLKREDLETVRTWRNSDHIKRYMEYQEYISPEQQLLWFESKKNSQDYFFIISHKNKPIGLIQLQNIEGEYAESGLFIGDKDALGSPLPFLASVAILDFAFSFLKLNSITAKVHNQNLTALKYNEALGFEYTSLINDSFVKLSLSQQNFHLKVQNNRAFQHLKSTYTMITGDVNLRDMKGLFISSVFVNAKP